MHHVCKPKRMFTGLLAVVLAGFIVQSAAASRVLQDASSAPKTPLVIPYLSHGVGVEQSLYSGTSTASSTKAPLVIPYLSHGIGVGKNQYGGQGAALSHTADAEQSFNSGTAQSLATQPSDVFTRAVERHIAFVNGMNATAASSRGYYDAARSVYVPAQQSTSAAPQSTAIRPDDRAGVRGISASDITAQSKSVAVRPDDRAGTRGIGTISAAQSTGSSSSTDWNTALMAGGALLGVLLIIGAAVAFGRRQHGRVLAH
jgi:hypothetical protein